MDLDATKSISPDITLTINNLPREVEKDRKPAGKITENIYATVTKKKKNATNNRRSTNSEFVSIYELTEAKHNSKLDTFRASPIFIDKDPGNFVAEYPQKCGRNRNFVNFDSFHPDNDEDILLAHEDEAEESVSQTDNKIIPSKETAGKKWPKVETTVCTQHKLPKVICFVEIMLPKYYSTYVSASFLTHLTFQNEDIIFQLKMFKHFKNQIMKLRTKIRTGGGAGLIFMF